MKNYLRSFLSILMILAMLSSGFVMADEVKYAETLTICYPDDLDSPNPYGSTSSSCHWYTNATHSVLIKNDYETGELVGVLAESWEDVNGNGTAWKLNLRQNVKFHDGTTFNADDVVVTWNWAKDINNVVKVINSADVQVKEVVAIDEYTVQFNMNYAIPDFPAYLELKMLSKEAFENMSADEAAAIGTGPYKKGEIISGVSYALDRFDDYYGGLELHPTKTIVVKTISDQNTAVAALQAGQVDYTFYLQAQNYNLLSWDPNLVTYTAPGCMSYYIGINQRYETWQNVELRQALAMAVNKDDIIMIAFEGGIGASYNDNFCVPTGAGYTEIDAIEYNPQKAAEIIEKHGLKGYELSIMASMPTKTWAEVLQANLNAVGFNAKIDIVDSAQWTALKSTHDYDVFIGDYASYTGALLYNFNRFFTVGGSSNLFGFENAEWEQLIKEANACTTYDDMLAKFAEMQQWVADNVPLIPYAVNNALACGHKDVGGVKVAPSYNLQEVAYLYKIIK